MCHNVLGLDKFAFEETKWKMEKKQGAQSLSSKWRSASLAPQQLIAFNYTLHGHILQYETSTKYLSCTLTSDLNWGTVTQDTRYKKLYFLSNIYKHIT